MATSFNNDIQYGGFWIRLLASLIDTVWLAALLILFALMLGIQNKFALLLSPTTPGQTVLSFITPIIIVLCFWFWRSATPGKMLLNLEIVDATTLAKPTRGQYIIRYIGYFIALIPFGLGFLWIALDLRKQGWHDKLANTVVIYLKQ